MLISINGVEAFNTEGVLLTQDILEYFSFLLHNSHETWPVGFLEHLFTL